MFRFRSKLADARRFLLVPVVVFGLTITFTSFTSVSERKGYFNPMEFVQWDAEHYISIAETGYTLGRCDPSLGYPPDAWCGNSGWFPGYPLLINLLTRLGFSGPNAGFLISHCFLFCTIFLIWNGFFAQEHSLKIINSMLLLSVFPGSIYYQAVFPLSMMAFFSLAGIFLAVRCRWNWVGVVGFAAAFTYPPGLALSILSISTLGEMSKSLLVRIINALKIAFMSLLGLIGVLVIHQLAVGAWDAFFRVQSKYGHALSNPLITLFEPIRAVVLFEMSNPSWLADVQTVVVVCLLIVLIYSCRHTLLRSRTQQYAILVSLSLWLLPLFVGKEVHLYRQEALLLPLVLLFPQAPRSLQVSVLLICAFLRYRMTVLFLHGILV